MQIDLPPSRRPGESILPMINVVFLLLIFFLISARLTPPEPFPVTPPDSVAEGKTEGEIVLFLAADGRLGFRETESVVLGAAESGGATMSDDPVLTALAAEVELLCAERSCEIPADRPPLQLRADTAVPATRLAQLMPVLGALGVARVDLLVVPQ